MPLLVHSMPHLNAQTSKLKQTISGHLGLKYVPMLEIHVMYGTAERPTQRSLNLCPKFFQVVLGTVFWPRYCDILFGEIPPESLKLDANVL